jgi:hypothetical protein
VKTRTTALALLFALVFLLTLLVHLPLRWALPLLPRALQCQGPEGSPWSGRCAALAWTASNGTMTIGDVSWTMRPARLLRTRLAFDVRLRRGLAQASALAQLGPGRVELLDVDARGPLDPSILKGFPPDWTGELEITGARLRLERGTLTALDGTVIARNLVSQSPGPTTWGSFQLRIPKRDGGALAPGELKDIEGPLQLLGTLQLGPDFSWKLEGRVAARPTAAPALVKLMQQLQGFGPADAQGLRPFSLGSL